ncbi:MAG: OmpH family outer membrane protein [Pseudomonadota bacterium]
MLNTLTATLPRQLVLMAALCACSLAQAQQAPSRIGYIATERLMTESKLAKAADAKIEAEFSRRQKSIQETIGRFKQMSDKFDAEAASLPEPERTKRARELIDLDKDLQRTQREFREDLIQRKSEERNNIGAKARKLIEQIAEQEKLDLVVEESIWWSPRIDLTDKVLKLLDK